MSRNITRKFMWYLYGGIITVHPVEQTVCAQPEMWSSGADRHISMKSQNPIGRDLCSGSMTSVWFHRYIYTIKQ